MEVRMTSKAKQVLSELQKGRNSNPARAKKVAKALGFLADDPAHPSLATHRYENLDDAFGEKMWQSNIEANVPSAWRMWWFYGPGSDEITVVDLGPHP